MYKNILEILNFNYKPMLLISVGTIALIGVNTCAFYSYSNQQQISQKPKQNIESPINQKGLENKLTPTPPKKNKENIFYNGYTQFV